MSHFTVAVFTKHNDAEELEKLLAPYQENSCGDCAKEYMEFVDEEDEHFEEYQNGSHEKVRCPDGSLKSTWDDEFRIPGEIGIGTNTHKVPEGEGYERVDVYFKDEFESFEEYMKEYVGYKDRDPETNRYGYWENPNAKWDWYSIGGRWSGRILMKPGKEGEVGTTAFLCKKVHNEGVDFALVSDVDFEAMQKREEEELEPYNEFIENSFFRKEYLEKKYPDEKSYIQQMTTFSTYAVVTPDGEWHSPGDMGWFGLSSETHEASKSFVDTYKEKFIKPAIENGWYITMVDCHI